MHATPVRSNPIPQELAQLLAPRILRGTLPEPGGCWLRSKGVNPNTGYTSITRTVDGKTTHYYAHRVMFVAVKGPIPEGSVIDHLCDQPACCNPEHLVAVTQRQNIMRATNQPCAANARKTHCPREHELIVLPSGKRGCRECPRARAAARYRSRKGARV